MSEPSKRGGARPGSGAPRKPASQSAVVRFSLALPPSEAAEYKRLGATRWIRLMISSSLTSTEIANNLDLDTQKKVVCVNCRQELIDWVPAPGQLVCEENWGPHIAVPSITNREARLSEPDSDGKRWLLVRMIPGEHKRYWPAQLSCKHCQKAEDAGRSACANWKAASLPSNPYSENRPTMGHHNEGD